MDKEWERLYEEAMSVLNPHDVSNKMWVGSVASAVLTKKGNIYKGICIDTDGSIGMCAERNALSTMLTYGESEITKVVSVYKDGNIIPSCGICREFMMHLGGDVENIDLGVARNDEHDAPAFDYPFFLRVDKRLQVGAASADEHRDPSVSHSRLLILSRRRRRRRPRR